MIPLDHESAPKPDPPKGFWITILFIGFFVIYEGCQLVTR